MANDVTQEEYLEGKISSFWELTGENAIEIPIIQRDYAQGRSDEDTRQVRVQFVKNIITTLEKRRPMQLDFVYGSLIDPPERQGVEPIEVFTPLDGQQRLTLLFLFHWFIALWNEDDFELFQKHLKSRFCYRTRNSSTEFCEKLIGFPDHSASVLRDKAADGKLHELILSDYIKNEGWFHGFWQYDPTISGMLVVLDTIKNTMLELFPESDIADVAHRYFRELLPGGDGSHPLITFQLLFLNRGDLHMTDELYIKMNSRGKPLTPFEIFKARFESFIRDDHDIDSKAFSFSIDHDWADKFWSVRDDVKPKNDANYSRDNTDEMMMNLIKASIANSYALLDNPEEWVMSELFEAKNMHDFKNLTFFGYEELGVFHEIIDEIKDEDKAAWRKQNHFICQGIVDSFTFFNDMLTDNGEVRKEYAIPDNLQGVKDMMKTVVFYNIDDNNSQYPTFSYNNRLYFYAYSRYGILFRDDVQSGGEDFSLWMRFVRNLVESVDININNVRNALVTIESILKDMKARGYTNINSYLDSFDDVEQLPDFKPFPASQMKEELMKAWLICAGANSAVDWSSAIIEADNMESWPGRSGYLFFFTGLSGYSHKDINSLDAKSLSDSLNIYQTYIKKMKALEAMLRQGEGGYLLEKALFCYGNYARYVKDTHDYAVHNLMDCSVNGRWYSWRHLLQYNGIPPTEDDGYVRGVETLKEVLDDEYFNADDAASSLRNIISHRKEDVKDWRRPIIERDELLSFPDKNYRYLWIDKFDAMLPNKKTEASNRLEVWSFVEFNKLESSYKKDDKPFHLIYYKNGGYFYMNFYDDADIHFCVNFSTNGKRWKVYFQKYDDIEGWIDATKDEDLEKAKTAFGEDATDVTYSFDADTNIFDTDTAVDKRIISICNNIKGRYTLEK